MASGIDSDLSVVDWVIDYPPAAAVFAEFGIDCCCAGKSLAYACLQARANPDVVQAKLRVIVERASHGPASGAARSLGDWVDRAPPGWVSRLSAAEADPIALAAEVRDHAQAVATWLGLPRQERWDTYELQSLSAALFNRYASGQLDGQGRRTHVGLLQLAWPVGTTAIQCCLAELQQRLVVSLAVYKAIRLPLPQEDCPTPLELVAAEADLAGQRHELADVAARLATSLRAFLESRTRRSVVNVSNPLAHPGD